MDEKRLVVTRCDSKAKELADMTHPIITCYCKIWKADFKIIGDEEGDTGDFEKNHYRIFKVADYLDEYDRVLVIDSDVVIMPGCPNPFDIVDPEKIGSIYEDVGSRREQRRQIINAIQEKFGDVGWKTGYINTGVLVVSKKHKKIFQKIDHQLWTGFGYDDALIGFNIHTWGFEVQELSFKFNHMSMFSEPWNDNANRFSSYIIHYAGAANFPDDLSERTSKTNSLEDRMKLMKSDIDRIAGGLLIFKETQPTPKQGLGSYVWQTFFGVQEKEIILKVHKTPDGLEREVLAFQHNIPYLVNFMGVCEDPNVGRFIMLEKLKDLPEKIDLELMREIATRSLIAMRQLYKHHIPWICRLDHIMLDEDGKVKLIDFNDEPCPKIPFYAEEDNEAIMMDGMCDSGGLYTHRYHCPRSGWIAIMKYLCKMNGLKSHFIIPDAEHAMIEYEYQALENVHQPIFFDQYKAILRRETEKDDKNYGKLVGPSRECEDRARLLRQHLGNSYISPPETPTETWLDIGCNVGWFCFAFRERFIMTGIDFDKAKIDFATMLAEGQNADVTFKTADINIEYVREMQRYDIISVLSTLHLKLVEDRDDLEFWKLFIGICDKANHVLFFEFPPHAYKYLDITTTEDFIEVVKINGKFKDVKQIGLSDANRPVLKCVKN